MFVKLPASNEETAEESDAWFNEWFFVRADAIVGFRDDGVDDSGCNLSVVTFNTSSGTETIPVSMGVHEIDHLIRAAQTGGSRQC